MSVVASHVSFFSLFAGFIHVNSGVSVLEVMNATKITIRETITYLFDINSLPDVPIISGRTNGKIEETYT